MINRRSFNQMLSGAALVAGGATAYAKASQPMTRVNFQVPDGACDCHTHIHGDPAVFPMSEKRVYTPESASPEEMLALHQALGVRRVVIVTPSVYGSDNSATIYGMKFRGADARGVAVIDSKTSEQELDDLAKLGFKGIRLNLRTNGISDPEQARLKFVEAEQRVKSRGWHIQINSTLDVLASIKSTLDESSVPVVFDHFAGADEAKGIGQPGFAALVDLVHKGKAYVKISVTEGVREHYEYFKPLAQTLIQANPQRILWGTNWPHPSSSSGRPAKELTPLWPVDDALVLNLLPTWAPDAQLRKTILVDNPAKLYAF
jgi:predicted TIM-barrel fold metal-dependent hydrolase